MRLAIINCSLHHENTDRTVDLLIRSLAEQPSFDIQVVTIDSYTKLFSGSFISLDTATNSQLKALRSMESADVLLFVCPTYYKTMPGSIKNFFDIVRDKRLYAGKLVLAVSSNHKNQDFGARDLLVAVAAMAEFYDTTIDIIPEIPIVDPDNFDSTVTDRVVELIQRYRPS